jgi:hypothetical protein
MILLNTKKNNLRVYRYKKELGKKIKNFRISKGYNGEYFAKSPE